MPTPPAELDGVPLAVAQEIFQAEVLRIPADGLSSWVGDPDPDVRRRVARALGRLRDPTAATSFLAVLAADTDVTVRREAAFALGQTPGTEAALLERWGVEADGEARARLAVALGKQGGPASLAPLAAALSGPPLALQAAAAEGIGRLGIRKVEGAASEVHVARLLDLLAFPVGPARERGAWALARMGTSTLSAATLDRMSTLATREPDATVRAWLWRAWAAGAGGEARREGLLRAAGDDAPGVRVVAARALGKECVDAGPLLVLAQDPHAGVRTEAVTALGSCAAPEVTDKLQALAAEGPPGERAVAVAALAATPARKAFAAAWYRDGEPLAVRCAAARALDDPRRLLTLATSATEGPLRSAATEALLERETIATSDLDALLAAKDPLIAGAAAEHLATAPDPLLEVGLLRRLERGDLDDATAASFVRALTALYKTGRIRDAAAHAAGVFPRYLARPGLAEDAAALAAVLKLEARAPTHETRRVPDLAEVLRVRSARIYTDEGEIRVNLHPEEAPYAVWNFASLADRGYFDGVTFHRVVADFVIQAGDPRGDGWGGPGWEIPDEINPTPYETGALGMALSGPDTGGSQWFITLSPQPHLDGTYTVFGNVTYGQRSAAAIVQGDRIEHIVIERLP